MELRPDATIAGKLRLLRPLGHGGMGVVWAARHLTLETDVAVKLIRPERVDPALVARFEREAKATARIAHPHVVQIMDYGAIDGAVPYIVMELLRGFSLAELIERGGRLSFATAKVLVEQIGSALETAHERGIVHRDIKPHNVFITDEGRGDGRGDGRNPLFVKVLDFGVAKVLGDAQVPGASAALTETGMVIGSPPYMSPEQLEGSALVDARSDLWSLGVIVYESLTGAQPFRGTSFVALGAAVLKGKYRPASEIRPNLPASIDDWFAKALSLDPDDRFQSARAMVEAFLRLDAPAPEIPPSFTAPHPIEYATTIVANSDPPETLEAPAPLVTLGGTANHSPAAKPPRSQPLSRKRRLALIGTALSLAIVAGAALSARARTAAHTPSTRPPGTVLIEGASFQMGSADGGETPADETPRHAVTVAPFFLDVTEVTVAAYSSCEACKRPSMTVEFEGLTPNGRSFWSQFCNRTEAHDHPINCIDWYEAKAYCTSLGKRLPTEAEWELAARGKEARTYPWGQSPPSSERLNACGSECSRMLTERLEKAGKDPWPRMYAEDDSAPSTSAVGRYPAGATPQGVLDLAGNVWEWTESHYCPYDKDDCDDSRRVLRGGGWDTVESQDVRAAHRYPTAPNARGKSIGFRCAKTP